MKKLITVTIFALSLQAGVMSAEENVPPVVLKTSTWHKLLRPPFKTVAVITDITAAVSLLAALKYGADILITNEKAAKDRFFESLGWLLGSYILNVFSKAALQEISH